MPNLSELPAHDENGALRVVVETPRGSRVKLKYEPRSNAFEFARPLALGVSYPFDWGFVPGTVAPDGDPLDAMIVSDNGGTFPGVVFRTRPIGVIQISQRSTSTNGRERNDRLIVVPLPEPRFAEVDCLPKRVREELEQFFLNATLFEPKEARIEGWAAADAARRLVRETLERDRPRAK